MNQPEFLKKLNDSQRAAVEYIDGPSLVIAGAGSGKTRVLTYKIAYLLTMDYKPWEIMALTFTNKAAKEMKERIARLVGMESARYLRMGTFHSVFASILRREANAIGYDSNFTIYDESDSRSLLKSIIKEFNFDEKLYKPAEVHKRISFAKNGLVTAEQYAEAHDLRQRDTDDKIPEVYNIYKEYWRRCHLNNAMDFDDLLLNTYILFCNEDVCNKYSHTYRFFLVDEYQDTNTAQQQIMYQLASEHQHICVVGDDAQSIYGFRGANIDNILHFQKQYDGAQLFKLEQNYRSTQRIVQAANSLIHKNEYQIPKEVFSRNDEGSRLQITELASDREEALYVSKNIQKMHSQGMPYSDFAILYRTNSQSRTFEEQFIKSAMPYRIYGGLSFYQRKEIKDIVAYFRLIINPDDDEALKRIINYPARGIGNTTLQRLEGVAHTAGTTMWQIITNIDNYDTGISKPTQNKLQMFRALIEGFSERLDKDDAFDLGRDIIKHTGISQDIYSSKDPEYLSRQENVEEFLGSIQEFVETQREMGQPTMLTDFLHDVTLLSDRDDNDDDMPKITLMTIHSAKGLEFPCVFVVGMEENIFPSQLSTNSKRELEEERRLLYVAITRAEKHCFLTYAKMRWRYGKQEFGSPSRFIRDIDHSLVTFNGSGNPADSRNTYGNRYGERRSFFGSAPEYMQQKPRFHTAAKPTPQPTTPPRQGLTRMNSAATSSPTSVKNPNTASPGILSVGDTVMHQRFGTGIITKLGGTGDSAKATVDFENAGTKNLLLKFAMLRKL